VGPVDLTILLAPDGQHRTGRGGDDAFGHAAEEKLREPCAPMGAEHDELDAPGPREAHDLLVRSALEQKPFARTRAFFAWATRASSFFCAHARLDVASSSYIRGETYPSPGTGTTGLITCAIRSSARLVLAVSIALRNAAREAPE
jgi:hypothetical protein